ncbi:transposase [Streptomyces sp. NBC_00237]|uniref:transposase n=1 Tax=Streptomyces sp. NBC_00237 TaxID=2975687 RepID=UPI002255A82D|nr:transposase [Streptomyces sp. NBC_00237]MCX5205699.1 transposase [Streptomyces sp. NBC_00237]
MAKGDLSARGKKVREQGAWLVLEDESGQSLRPPTACTWPRIGLAPQVKASGKGSGRISLAGMVCARAGERTRLMYRILVHHPGRRSERKGFRERDFARLLDMAHQQIGGNIVLVWDNSSHHKDALMRELLAARAQWLTVFRLPPYAPHLNPAEGVWAHLKNDLGILAARTADHLAELTRTRLKRMQYRPSLLDGFIAETGLTPAPP